jgi:hypothetical protein
MLRRSFVAASGSLCLAPAAAALAAGRPEERAPEAPLLRTVVTNLPASLPPGMATGTRLVLKRAPERSYDPRSIAAFTRDGQRLGYLPGRPTRVIAALMDQGVEVEAVVVERRSGRRPALTVDVSLTGGGAAAIG